MLVETKPNHWIVEPDSCKFCGKSMYKNEEDAEYFSRQYTNLTKPYICPDGMGWHLRSVKE